MAATESTMLALGTPAPAFALPNVASGAVTSLESAAEGLPFLVVFLCAHCPYVLHVAPELARIARDYSDKPLKIFGITSNDIAEYPQDAPAPTADFARAHGLEFPILFDETQEVARNYTASCTPDFFLFGADHTLFYRGQIDGSRPMRSAERPGSGVLNGAELRQAIDAVLAGLPAPEVQRPSIGCSIKWKSGATGASSH
jgi:peroxiredoxin